MQKSRIKHQRLFQLSLIGTIESVDHTSVRFRDANVKVKISSFEQKVKRPKK